MPRTTSLQKALEALSDLGLIVTPDSYRDRDGDVYQTIVWALSPSYFLQVATPEAKKNWHRNDLEHGNTVGMALLFDQDEKFVSGSYGHLYWDDYDGTPGWEVRTTVSTWNVDEKTLKASLAWLRAVSPVGTAEAEKAAQEAAQAAEKAEQERQAALTALNETLAENPDTRGWAGAIAATVAYEKRRAIAELRDFAKRCEEAANQLERGDKASRLWFHGTSVVSIVEHLSTLAALEDTVSGPLAEVIAAMQERYGY